LIIDSKNTIAVLGPPLLGSGGGGGTGNTNLFVHLVTAGEETSQIVTLSNVAPPLTVNLNLIIFRQNGDIVNPGDGGTSSIMVSGSDIVITFDLFAIEAGDQVLGIQGVAA